MSKRDYAYEALARNLPVLFSMERELKTKPVVPIDVRRYRFCREIKVPVKGENGVLGSSRGLEVVAARHCVYYLLRKTTPMSYPEIGDFMNRDHSGVMYGIGKVEKAIERYNEELKGQGIESSLGNKIYFPEYAPVFNGREFIDGDGI